MKIQVGKSYRTRNGEKAFVAKQICDHEPHDRWPFKGTVGRRERSWTRGGRAGFDPTKDSFDDLVSEWADPDPLDSVLGAYCFECGELSGATKTLHRLLESGELSLEQIRRAAEEGN